ncbi:hypothetical protein A2U01_0027672 [Trifolium medium]|uniref:Uncharacterized protein n=1 Tax=Trifolium medium TaxID=97028 RepID=A0A392P4E0_9FABA|nr:hypothetical protein [Trifolium medium]
MNRARGTCARKRSATAKKQRRPMTKEQPQRNITTTQRGAKRLAHKGCDAPVGLRWTRQRAQLLERELREVEIRTRLKPNRRMERVRSKRERRLAPNESELGAIKGDKRLIVFLIDSIDNER